MTREEIKEQILQLSDDRIASAAECIQEASKANLEKNDDEILCVYDRHAGFVEGAEWMEEQFEKNRIMACDNQTDEEREREEKFCCEFIQKNHRIPTISDTIEITRKDMIDKACKIFKEYCLLNDDSLARFRYMLEKKNDEL